MSQFLSTKDWVESIEFFRLFFVQVLSEVKKAIIPYCRAKWLEFFLLLLYTRYLLVTKNNLFKLNCYNAKSTTLLQLFSSTKTELNFVPCCFNLGSILMKTNKTTTTKMMGRCAQSKKHEFRLRTNSRWKQKRESNWVIYEKRKLTISKTTNAAG